MSIEFHKQIYWVRGMRGVASSVKVDGKVISFILEGRAIAEYFGVPNEDWRIEKAYLQNRSFLEEIVIDAIRRDMLNKFGELLLGKDELAPYFEKRSATAPA